MKTLGKPEGILTAAELTAASIIHARREKQKLEEYPQILQSKLHSYPNGVFDSGFVGYLEALINLEENLLKDENIRPEIIELLQSIELLKQIVTYNIYGCARKTLENTGVEISQTFNDKEISLSASTTKSELIFASDFSDPICPNFQVYSLKEDKELRSERIAALKNELNKAMSETNPYKDWGVYYTKQSGQSFGGLSRSTHLASDYDIWNAEHEQIIQKIKDAIQQLENRRTLTAKEKGYSSQSQKVVQAFQKEYGITGFEEMGGQGAEIRGKILVKKPFGEINITKFYY